MRMWHSKIHEDLAPLTVIARGFGGSTMFDLLHYTDRIVLPYKPRAIVVYEGDNDVAIGVGPEEIRDTFRKFVHKVHAALPQTRIYFLAIKPSYSRHAEMAHHATGEQADCRGLRPRPAIALRRYRSHSLGRAGASAT